MSDEKHIQSMQKHARATYRAAVSSKNKALAVPSPCISICQMNDATGLCTGCLRTMDEIAAWGDMDSTERIGVWNQLEQRG